MCNGHSWVASYSGPNYFFLVLELRKVWVVFFSLSIQTRVLVEIFRIILMPSQKVEKNLIKKLHLQGLIEPQSTIFWLQEILRIKKHLYGGFDLEFDKKQDKA